MPSVTEWHFRISTIDVSGLNSYGYNTKCTFSTICFQFNLYIYGKSQRLSTIVTSLYNQGVATGAISVYIPPNQYTLNFLCGCFVSLQWLVNIYTHPNQIPGYATVYNTAFNEKQVQYWCSLIIDHYIVWLPKLRTPKPNRERNKRWIYDKLLPVQYNYALLLI